MSDSQKYVQVSMESTRIITLSGPINTSFKHRPPEPRHTKIWSYLLNCSSCTCCPLKGDTVRCVYGGACCAETICSPVVADEAVDPDPHVCPYPVPLSEGQSRFRWVNAQQRRQEQRNTKSQTDRHVRHLAGNIGYNENKK